jgi:hypothetical protein
MVVLRVGWITAAAAMGSMDINAVDGEIYSGE